MVAQQNLRNFAADYKTKVIPPSSPAPSSFAVSCLCIRRPQMLNQGFAGRGSPSSSASAFTSRTCLGTSPRSSGTESRATWPSTRPSRLTCRRSAGMSAPSAPAGPTRPTPHGLDASPISTPRARAWPCRRRSGRATCAEAVRAHSDFAPACSATIYRSIDVYM